MWRRFMRKNRVTFFVSFIVLVVVALVGVLMYMLSSMNWRTRY